MRGYQIIISICDVLFQRYQYYVPTICYYRTRCILYFSQLSNTNNPENVGSIFQPIRLSCQEPRQQRLNQPQQQIRYLCDRRAAVKMREMKMQRPSQIRRREKKKRLDQRILLSLPRTQKKNEEYTVSQSGGVRRREVFSRDIFTWKFLPMLFLSVIGTNEELGRSLSPCFCFYAPVYH